MKLSLALFLILFLCGTCYASSEEWMNFKSGNDLYRKKQYDEAIKSYEKSILSANKAVEAALNYNIGNCKFRQGKAKESSDLAAAIADYRASLDYYKRAMELGPDDKDAKFNHEFVEKLLKLLMDKQKQEPKSGHDNKEEQNAKQAEQRTQEQKEQGQQPQEAGGDITTAAGKELNKEMSKEEARMLLDDYRQQEQQDRQLNDKHEPPRYPDVEKDW